MNELLETATDWFGGGWDSAATDCDDPHDRLNKYIIGPVPLPDELYDEGGCE